MNKLMIAAILLTMVSCAQVPLTGRKQLNAIPSSEINTLAADNYTEVKQEVGISNNARYNELVNSVGQRITSAVDKYLKENGLESRIDGYKWEYVVLKSDEINAWCMPGGKIGFYEGIFPVCEDANGVAVVMSHEIAHAVAHHGNERMSQQLLVNMGGVALSEALKTKKEETQQLAMTAFGVGSQLGVMLPYSRIHEQEADEMGLYFMAMAGFDPQKAPEFWNRMMALNQARPPEFLSTHPDPENRIKDLEKHMKKAMEFYEASK
jgi:predicted Zn-dependent protease